jgi:hypothetical protein
VDVHLERGDGGTRRVGSPERVDQLVPRDDGVCVQQQQDEQGALLRRAERERAFVAQCLDRAQDAEFDARRPLESRLKQKLSAGRDSAHVL